MPNIHPKDDLPSIPDAYLPAVGQPVLITFLIDHTGGADPDLGSVQVLLY